LTFPVQGRSFSSPLPRLSFNPGFPLRAADLLKAWADVTVCFFFPVDVRECCAICFFAILFFFQLAAAVADIVTSFLPFAGPFLVFPQSPSQSLRGHRRVFLSFFLSCRCPFSPFIAPLCFGEGAVPIAPFTVARGRHLFTRFGAAPIPSLCSFFCLPGLGGFSCV